MMTGAVPVQSPLDLAADDPTIRWFAPRGSVVQRDGRAEVFVGGTLIGCFGQGEYGARNAILIGLAQDPNAHYGQIAQAFGLSSEALRLIRRVHEAEGVAGVVARARGGSEPKMTSALRRTLEALFEHGASVSSAHAQVVKRHRIGRSTVGKVRVAWAAARATQNAPAADDPHPAVEQPDLPVLGRSHAPAEVGAQPSDAESAQERVEPGDAGPSTSPLVDPPVDAGGGERNERTAGPEGSPALIDRR
jgi:hypothetical protein